MEKLFKTIQPNQCELCPTFPTLIIFGVCCASHCVRNVVTHDTVLTVFHYGLELYQ